jgi:probable RNA-binding protein EIF1AD
MPVKFRKSVWTKRGDFVVIEPIEEGNKVKAEIVQILNKDNIRYYKSKNIWPKEFEVEVEEVIKDKDGNDRDIYPSSSDEEDYDENETSEYKSNNLNKIN